MKTEGVSQQETYNTIPSSSSVVQKLTVLLYLFKTWPFHIDNRSMEQKEPRNEYRHVLPSELWKYNKEIQ